MIVTVAFWIIDVVSVIVTVVFGNIAVIFATVRMSFMTISTIVAMVTTFPGAISAIVVAVSMFPGMPVDRIGSLCRGGGCGSARSADGLAMLQGEYGRAVDIEHLVGRQGNIIAVGLGGGGVGHAALDAVQRTGAVGISVVGHQ